MTTTAPDPAVARLLEQTLRADRGRILSALIARVRDFGLAEEALHDAAASALIHWARDLPARPEAWLIRVAFRKAIDRLRRQARDRAQSEAMAVLARDEACEDPDLIADERLRLIFTCCHPALEPKSRVALTLRTIAGLTTAEIARAFLDQEATMAQRLTRAKARIADAGIPFAVPGPEDWGERLQSVLAVVYLIFNAGYTAGPGEPRDLCDEAIYLVRMINALRPGDAEVEGCLALFMITHARRAARQAQGATVPLAGQDRALWDHAAIAQGLDLIDQAMARRTPGPYQIKAAIAACHVQGDVPDWPQIALLYASLYRMEPTAVVQLNRAVALAETGALDVALSVLAALAGTLDAYQPFHAAHAEYLARKGDPAARAAYDRAIALATNPADATWLTARRDGLIQMQ
jgi:RNA polymerase sigma-70 factor (ECF subfamily)